MTDYEEEFTVPQSPRSPGELTSNPSDEDPLDTPQQTQEEFPNDGVVTLPDRGDQEPIAADEELLKDYESDAEYIELIHLKIGDLGDLGLSRFTKLRSLCLRQNLIDSLHPVKDLPASLEELDLYDNRIRHISSQIAALPNLTMLDLSFNNIKHIKNLETLTKLKTLFFVQNKISDITNLDNLTNLTSLELGGNRIKKIDGLDKLTQLNDLWLGKNKIGRLENLSCLVNLRVLSIQSNRLTKIEGLEALVNLEELYLSYNGLTKLEGLENNVNLTVLDISGNEIEKLENVSHLKKLTDFWASYNKFSDFRDIAEQLGKLPEIDTVYFEGNPVQTSNPVLYRNKLRLCFGESLKKIDATYIRV